MDHVPLRSSLRHVVCSMLKKIRNWLGIFLAEQTIVQLFSVVPVAYSIGLTVEAWQGAKIMFGTLPPLFWPILAALVLAVTFYPGFIAPFVKSRRLKLDAYRQELEIAYTNVSHAHKPGILNPKQPGNPHAIKEYAQNSVDALRPKLVRKHKNKGVPSIINMDDKSSIRQWYEFLRNERAGFSD